MNKLPRCLAAAATLLALAGCASSPTTADLMRSHATDAQGDVNLKNQLAKDWEKGSKLMASGTKQVEEGKEMIDDAEDALKEGRELVDEGNRDIDEGRRLMLNSERQFKENFPGLELKQGN